MRVPKRILEVHETELGLIFLERPATWREVMSWRIESIWEWLSNLIGEIPSHPTESK